MSEEKEYILFGFWEGLPYGEPVDTFEKLESYKNTIDRGLVIKHIKSLGMGVSGTYSQDRFTGETYNASIYNDGDFVFSIDFFRYYKRGILNLPPTYEDYLKKIFYKKEYNEFRKWSRMLRNALCKVKKFEPNYYKHCMQDGFSDPYSHIDSLLWNDWKNNLHRLKSKYGIEDTDRRRGAPIRVGETSLPIYASELRFWNFFFNLVEEKLKEVPFNYKKTYSHYGNPYYYVLDLINKDYQYRTEILRDKFKDVERIPHNYICDAIDFYRCALMGGFAYVSDMINHKVEQKEKIIKFLENGYVYEKYEDNMVDFIEDKELDEQLVCYYYGNFYWTNEIIYHFKKYDIELKEDFMKYINNYDWSTQYEV